MEKNKIFRVFGGRKVDENWKIKLPVTAAIFLKVNKGDYVCVCLNEDSQVVLVNGNDYRRSKRS